MSSKETRRLSYEEGKKRGLCGENGIQFGDVVSSMFGGADIGALDKGFQDGREEAERRVAGSGTNLVGSGEELLGMLAGPVLLALVALGSLVLLVGPWLIWAGGFGLVYSVAEVAIGKRPAVTVSRILEVARRNSIWLLVPAICLHAITGILAVLADDGAAVGPMGLWVFLCVFSLGPIVGCAYTAWLERDTLLRSAAMYKAIGRGFAGALFGLMAGPFAATGVFVLAIWMIEGDLPTADRELRGAFEIALVVTVMIICTIAGLFVAVVAGLRWVVGFLFVIMITGVIAVSILAGGG